MLFHCAEYCTVCYMLSIVADFYCNYCYQEAGCLLGFMTFWERSSLLSSEMLLLIFVCRLLCYITFVEKVLCCVSLLM